MTERGEKTTTNNRPEKERAGSRKTKKSSESTSARRATGPGSSPEAEAPPRAAAAPNTALARAPCRESAAGSIGAAEARELACCDASGIVSVGAGQDPTPLPGRGFCHEWGANERLHYEHFMRFIDLGPSGPLHYNWPRLDPLRVRPALFGDLASEAHRQAAVDALSSNSSEPTAYRVVDTAPGELAFLELIGCPDHPLPEGDGLLHLATHHDAIDTMVRIVRFFLRAAVLPEAGDDEKISRTFAAVYGCEPDTRRNELVAKHVEGWGIGTFWRKELTAGERVPARPGEDDAQTIERIRRVMRTQGRVDPGPPEGWSAQDALLMQTLMRELGDDAAASLAFAVYEDADDIETIERKRRTLLERWGVAVAPRPDGWTLSQTAAVYRLLVALGGFGARVSEIEPQKVFDALRSYNANAVLKQRTKYKDEFLRARDAGDEVAMADLAKKAQAYLEHEKHKRGPGKPNEAQVVTKILMLAGFTDSEDALRRARQRGREKK